MVSKEYEDIQTVALAVLAMQRYAVVGVTHDRTRILTSGRVIFEFCIGHRSGISTLVVYKGDGGNDR